MHHDSYDAFLELKTLKRESRDPQAVYRMANIFEHKKDDSLLRLKIRNAEARQIILNPFWPDQTAKNKHKKYLKAYKKYRQSVIDNAAEWAKFIKEHKPLKEKFTEKELQTICKRVKYALWMEAMGEAIIKWCREVVL